MSTLKNIILANSILILISCSGKNSKSDAYGNFETVDVMVASEMQGRLVKFTIEEGKNVKAGEQVGLIDTIQLSLKSDQLVAQRNMSATKFQNILSQIKVQEEQKQTLLTEKRRLENLLKENAAPQKQLDDVNGKISVIESQVTSIKTQNSTVINELEMFDKQIAQVKDQINRCKIINPIEGTVLEKYYEESEIASPGKVLYKVADIRKMILRVYISGAQLSEVKTGQKVKVLIDKNKKEKSEMDGVVSWISPQAEFTPKIIQTREERVNLVYAVKVDVPNDGRLKIGMPGEIKWK
jgi:HlyD family secretion protein